MEGILKNNLRLFQLDSKTVAVYHSAITSSNLPNMKAIPTLILLGDISKKIIGGGLLHIANYDLRYEVTQTDFSTNYNVAHVCVVHEAPDLRVTNKEL